MRITASKEQVRKGQIMYLLHGIPKLEFLGSRVRQERGAESNDGRQSDPLEIQGLSRFICRGNWPDAHSGPLARPPWTSIKHGVRFPFPWRLNHGRADTYRGKLVEAKL